MVSIPLTVTPTSKQIALEIAAHARRIRHLQSLQQVIKKIESEPLDLQEPQKVEKEQLCSI
jgi:hypothetical protein